MLVESENAYLLHTRNYTDSRVLLELLSEKHGRIATVWRANRKSKKSFLPQQFSLVSISFRGRSQLKTLTSIEALALPHSLVGNVLYCGLYINELLLRLTVNDDPCPSLFARYRQVMQDLEGGDVEAALRRFEFGLLQDLGYAIDFDHDAYGNAINPVTSATYVYVPDQGFVPCDQNTPSAYAAVQLRAMRDGAWGSADVLRAGKILSRHALAPLIGNKPLKAREFFK